MIKITRTASDKAAMAPPLGLIAAVLAVQTNRGFLRCDEVAMLDAVLQVNDC